jgi:hypothetical protein
MPSAGIEPTIAVLEWAKTVRALGHAATAIGYILHEELIFLVVVCITEILCDIFKIL